MIRSCPCMSVGDMLKDGKFYIVPPFQRNYSWEAEQITDFWADLIYLYDSAEDDYFIGSIVVTPHEEKNKVIILDGQQRFATVLLFLAALRDVLKKNNIEGKGDWIDDIDRIIYTRDTPSREKNQKIELNNEDKDFFNNMVTTGNIIVSKYKSHKLIGFAYGFFINKISKMMSEHKGKFVENILQVILKKLSIIRIEVDSDVDANMIFETLNDRGLELSVADLVKNYIFSIAGKKLTDVMQLWKEMIDAIGDYAVTKFLRHYWISSYELVKKEELYKKLKKRIISDNVIQFMQCLSREASIYANLKSPTHEFWGDSEIEDMIDELNKLRVEQIYILLLALYNNYYASNKKAFTKLLSIIISFTFRYNTICGFDPKALENLYGNLSSKIRKNKIKQSDIIKEIGVLNPSEDKFMAAFRDFETKNSKLAKYILIEVNNYFLEKAGKKDIQVRISKTNLEHIIPQNPNSEWVKYLKTYNIEREKWVYKIGNMTILLKEYNKTLANKFFNKKIVMYRKSGLPLNKQLVQYKNFGSKEIEERQKVIAEVANSHWEVRGRL